MVKKSKEQEVKRKQIRQRLKVEDSNFEPPDGGWGWLIVFACGFSNLSTFPMFQQFGLVFRGKFQEIGISQTQTTTIINLNSAFNAGMGLINGPLFRKFTYRQVAMFGSCLVTGSLFICSFCGSLFTYLIFYSMCYGSGIGITQSSNALALNTYFKEKRRIATGLSWTTTALGPIVWPYIIVLLNELYGVEGTLLLFSGFAMHSFVCSLLLQPVDWHTKFKNDVPESLLLIEKTNNLNTCSEPKKMFRTNSPGIFSSQYLRNEDDPYEAGYEITDPGTPMMVKANDGWYSQNRSLIGSRLSLYSNKNVKYLTEQASAGVSQKPSYNNLTDDVVKEFKKRDRKVSQSRPVIREEIEDFRNGTSNSYERVHCMHSTQECVNEKEVLTDAAKRLELYKQQHGEKGEMSQITEEFENKSDISLLKKISIFFDFDLFNDFTYVNLMLGITIANFAELNFSILTPIVLKEFMFEKYEIATFMSLLGAMDIVIRFFIPFMADKIGWSNRVFFLIGVMSMAFGRIILVHTQTYTLSLLVAMIIGAGKALRTIFMALVIPSYVPLERLPAASGLQLATSGLLFIILGPIVGWIREATGNYVITLHILNVCTYTTAVAWTVQILKTKFQNKSGN